MYSKEALKTIVPFKVKTPTHRDLFLTDPIKYAEESVLELQSQLPTCKSAKKAAKINARISFWLQVLAFDKVQREKEESSRAVRTTGTVVNGQPSAGHGEQS